MDDHQIYATAHEVLASICDDVNDGAYHPHHPLQLSWSDGPIGAWAESASPPGDPPRHKIVIRYELARQLYRDVEDFLVFAQGPLQDERLQRFFHHLDPYPAIPDDFTLEQSTHTMFVAALTWVFFHELGHLTQEHGYIRAMHGLGVSGQPFTVADCDVDADTPLTGRQAAVSHATELAADFEACFMCFAELVRQFTDPRLAGPTNNGSRFVGAGYLYICAIALVMYRFNGGRFADRAWNAEGSHPPPLYRLDAVLPQFYELADSAAVREITGHDLDRTRLVQLSGRAAFAVAFYWFEKSEQERGPVENYLPIGVLNSPPMMAYTCEMIEIWDELVPQIQAVRRDDNPYSFMRFTDEFRAKLGLSVQTLD